MGATDAWDTPLGRWALAWRDFRALEREGRIVRAPDPCAAADAAYADAIALAHEVCDDAIAADAAAGVVPAPLMVYGATGGDA